MKNTSKILILFLLAAACYVILAGCAGGGGSTNPSNGKTTATTTAADSSGTHTSPAVSGKSTTNPPVYADPSVFQLDVDDDGKDETVAYNERNNKLTISRNGDELMVIDLSELGVDIDKALAHEDLKYYYEFAAGPGGKIFLRVNSAEFTKHTGDNRYYEVADAYYSLAGWKLSQVEQINYTWVRDAWNYPRGTENITVNGAPVSSAALETVYAKYTPIEGTFYDMPQ